MDADLRFIKIAAKGTGECREGSVEAPKAMPLLFGESHEGSTLS